MRSRASILFQALGMLAGEQQPQLGPQLYLLLERAQTWVDTEGGRIQSTVDSQSSESLKAAGSNHGASKIFL